MITLKQIFLVISIATPNFIFAVTDDLILGKHQILKETKVIIKDNKFHQVKLFMKDGVFELRSVEYNQPIPGYRFKKDPIEIETYEAVFLDSKGKQLYQVNIGNPLLVKAQHIGFEDSEFFYGYDNQASFYIPFPKNIEPDAVVIYKDLVNTKEKLQTISIN